MEVDRFLEESLTMSRLKHGNLLSLIGVCLDSGTAPYIILPYMAYGSLLMYLRRERSDIVLSEETSREKVIFAIRNNYCISYYSLCR